MKLFLLPLAALVLLPAVRARGADTGLRGTVAVSGSEVVIQLRHTENQPAAAVQIRLLDARKLVVAVGHTDLAGRWVHTAERTGTYEGIVESGPDGAESLRLVFAVVELSPPPRFAWGLAAVGLACGVSAFGLFLCRPTSRRGLARLRIALLTACVGLLGWAVGRYWLEPRAPAAAPVPDMAGAARAFLRERQVKPLSEPLARLLGNATAKRVETQPHPLLGQLAPDFELAGAQGQDNRLRDQLRRGPVVLVFYYGYSCNHCVAELFALHDDLAKFRELGAEVMAVSADPPELTRARFRQYGPFAFPVLSDPGHTVARAYGVYEPAAGAKAEDMRHGTFVIGRDGRVHWAHCGFEPFTGNRTLLYELARLEGQLPGENRE